jgi:flavin-dependent dehydrogenase
LHRILVDHAQAAGVECRWGSAVEFDAIRAGWIVGADGENSRVRNWAGLNRCVRDRRRFGFRRHYRIAPWTDRMELYWADGCQVYVTPVSADSVCVAALSRDSQLRLDDALRNFPDLARRLPPDAVLTAERGAVSSSRRLEAVYRGRVALVGDASGSVDAITGEGLCLAFRQAVALVESIESGDLALYQQRHRRIARRAERMAGLLLMLCDHGRVRHQALRLLSANPKIFSKLLAVHVGAFNEIDTSDVSGRSHELVWAGDSARTGTRTNPC